MLRILLLSALVVLLSAPVHAESHLLRQPTYANGKVAFSYLGDIWIANDDGSNIRRLTVNRARDVVPRFSPDGKTIAFSSNRAGNYDVYVIPVEGGKPRQLTFNTADDYVVGWTPDGRKIIFSSSRNLGAFPGVSTLFEVSIDGGMEQPLPTDWGSWASYSPDGAKMAFTRHPGVWSRKHYRGSYNADLWLMDVAAKSFAKLTIPDYQGNYLWPMYGHDGWIYFVADCVPDEKHAKWGGPEIMKSCNNIWKIAEHGGTPAQVTYYTDGNLFFPSMSADGKTIVYEENFGLWKVDVASGNISEIPIDIRSDDKENEVELHTFENDADAFSLSPSNKRAAIATHGEIFTIATDRGEVQRVTETPWREKSPRWSPDGRWIAFVSDRTGREELYIADELGQQLKKLTDADCEKSAFVWAPDSKSLLWSGSDHKLRRVEIDGGNTEQVAESDVDTIGSPQFSPDGKWVSYSKDDKLLHSHVYLKPLDGGDERAIESDQFLLASGAKWTPDGKTLLLVGGVGAPGMASLNRTTAQLFSVALTHIAKNPDDRDVDSESQAESADAPRHGPGLGGKPASDGKVEVKIEWDGLPGRVKQLTHLSGSVSMVAPSPDSRTYAFIGSDESDDEDGPSGRPALYTIGADGSRLNKVAQISPDATDAAPRGRGRFGGIGDPQWSHDGHSIYYLQGGGIYAVGVSSAPAEESGSASADSGGGRGRGRFGRPGGSSPETPAAATATPRRIPFTVRMQVDRTAERRQVFEEAWRVMKYRFYDGAMHGVNWAAAKETYEPLLADLADTEELHNIVMQMIGELNASHTGISGGEDPSQGEERLVTRYPGFNLEPDKMAPGYYKVSYIYQKGPADHDYVKLKVGNYVLAVNGRELKTGDNLWKLFNLVPGRKFDFTVNDKPQLEGAWHVSLEPLSPGAQSDLEYDRWVAARKEMVRKLSDGQIGYLHIRTMDASSLRRFERDLLDNLGKKALMIDERFNGGGIDQELLEILNQRKKYESYRNRDSVEVPRPVQTFYGPMAVLQNERSASDAEMFPEGFRTLGLGKLVGMPTYGAVIGTGSTRLMDGSTLRVPSVGVYTAKGQDFENFGVVPDVEIDNTPADFLAGRDRQIEAAVKLLRSEIK